MSNTQEAGRATLREANMARQQEWDAGNQITLAYRGNELAGEAGEACNVIKKLERERLGIRGSRASKEQLAEELADVVICADLIAMDAGIDLDAAVVAKFNATSEKNGLTTRLLSRPTGEPSGAEEMRDGGRPLPFDRDTVGRMVREAWVRWAQTQSAPKPAWLVPYDELSEANKEADRQIGEAVARWTLIHDAARAAIPRPSTGGTDGKSAEEIANDILPWMVGSGLDKQFPEVRARIAAAIREDRTSRAATEARGDLQTMHALLDEEESP